MKEGNFNDKNFNREKNEMISSSHTFKSQIIPREWKDDIDRILSDELLGANRYFAKINPKISQLVDNEANKIPELFYDDLQKRWEWHNRFYEDLLEPALPAMIEEDYKELSLLQVDVLRDSYKTASLVDQATLIITASIKKHIAKWIDDESLSYLSEDKKSKLLTLPVDSFWTQYHIDHLKYIIAKKQSDSQINEIRNQLLKKYHAGDEAIFNGRLKKFNHYLDLGIDELENKSRSMKLDSDAKIHNFYLTIEKPRLKAIQDILIYDNIEEKKIETMLIGISGFILRKKILGYLKKSNVMDNGGKIYEFPDDVILEGLNSLRNDQAKSFEKKVIPYQQTSDTCGASSLMMALNYFGKSDLSRKKEDYFHLRSKSNYLEGNHFSALAKEAAHSGLETVLVHSEPMMFKNEGMFNDDFFKILMKEYEGFLIGAKKMGAKVMNGKVINYKSIKSYLENDYLVLLAGRLGNVLHAVLAVGYNQEGIIICDPLSGKKEIWSDDDVRGFIETPIGKWSLAIRKNHASLKNMMNNLERFNEEADVFLNNK